MFGATATLSPPHFVSDERLAQQVVSAIRRGGVRALPGLWVTAADGSVTVQGRARSFYEKQLVLHACRRVPGVRQIVDEIEVDAVPFR